MFEPSAPESAPQPPPPQPPARPASEGSALRLVRAVRDAQRADYWSIGIAGAITLLVTGLCGAVFLANVSVSAAHWLVGVAVLGAVGVALAIGVWLSNRRVGSDERTAAFLADVSPTLRLDLLSAVELSKAFGRREDFSPQLARAFIADVDARAAKESVSKLLDRRPARAAWATMVLAWLTALGLCVVFSARFNEGMAHLAAGTPVATIQRKAITGDVTLTYRYPVYTGLETRTVTGTTGEVSGPAGTEVLVETRADRDVDGAALDVNGSRIALQVKGRELKGSFTLDKPGQYHVVFLDGRSVAAEGPDLAIHVEADAAPDVKLTAPANELEVDDAKGSVTVSFNITDDYGLTAAALVYRVQGQPEARVKLRNDDSRTMRGDYQWDIGALNVRPGATVSYFLEATDNDALAGPKKGVSRTQTFTLYSAAAHQREALARAQALWDRLVIHLADRLETPDRKQPVEDAQVGKPIDDRAKVLAVEMQEFSTSNLNERDPLKYVPEAFALAAQDLTADTRAIITRRRPQARLQALIDVDVRHSERNIIYLESLLDAVRLDAIRELARELKEDRRELSNLIEEFSKTKDPATQQQLLDEVSRLREKMQDLQRRMAELRRGIHDEFMNRDAFKEMDEQNMSNALDDVEKLVKEGNAEEAVKKMQELAMQMDEMAESLEEAADRAEEDADPELAQMFDEFQKDLNATAAEQEKVAKQTQALRDKAREAAKARIEREGQAVKKELMKTLDELNQSYSSLPTQPRPWLQDGKEKVLRDVNATKQALEANEFSLANDSAQSMEQQAMSMEQIAEGQRAFDEAQMPPEVRKQSKQLSEKLARDAQKASEIAKKLESLFPRGSQNLSESDKQQLEKLQQEQQQLGSKAKQLRQKMDEISERAPVFEDDAKEQMDQAGQHMDRASQKLGGKDPSGSSNEQQGAMQSLQALQQQVQQMQQPGDGSPGGKGIPKPVLRMGSGRGRSKGTDNKRVEIPDEDPNKAARELRQDVMNAMKQGAPDKYKDQNKKYYEELVK